jgi:putative membrane protein
MVIVAYFGMGYLSWTLSLIFNRQLGKKLKGLQVFLVPFVASFIMVMWDVVMDPIAATIKKTWIWENGGNYFGVPISNYFGWFFVVYVFLQLFAIYIYKFDKIKSDTYYKNSFWTQCSITYGIVGFTYIIQTVLSNSNKEIYTATGLISVFTMIFIAFLSVISVMNSNEIRYVEEKVVTPDNEAVKSFATTRN